VWNFTLHNAKQIPHHDFTKLPNGNVLLIVWEVKSARETIAAGRRQQSDAGPWLVDSVLEIKPTGKTTGEVVWDWHVWDHLIQDLDPSRQNHGDVAAHPELVDINFGETLLAEVTRPRESPGEEAERKRNLNTLMGIGYLGATAAPGRPGVMPDWTHINAIDYDAELDQIILTVRAFREFWIIDHGTTTAQARGHTGGRYRMGGDLLYRWGNPQAYRAGTEKDQRLFSPHGAHWIPRRCPGAGHVLVFNNGIGRPGGDYSSVDEIDLPVDAAGRYSRERGIAYGPKMPLWTYTASERKDFCARLLSSAQRLPNGNTLICDGVSGTLFEVTPDRAIVWQRQSPRGDPPRPRAVDPLPGSLAATIQPQRILSHGVIDALELSPEQRKVLDDLQHETEGRLDTVLSDWQKARLTELSSAGATAFGGVAAPGQLMSTSREMMLKPSPEQKKEMLALQKRIDEKLGSVLTAGQKTRLEKIKQDFARGGRLGRDNAESANAGPSGPPGRLGAVAGGLPDPPVSIPPGVNPVFCATRYGPDYTGLTGRLPRPPD
jgi:hypothetical protein